MPKNINDNVLESRISNGLFTFHILAPLLLSTANKLVVSVVDLVEQVVMTILLSDPEALPSLQPCSCLLPGASIHGSLQGQNHQVLPRHQVRVLRDLCIWWLQC